MPFLTCFIKGSYQFEFSVSCLKSYNPTLTTDLIINSFLIKIKFFPKEYRILLVWPYLFLYFPFSSTLTRKRKWASFWSSNLKLWTLLLVVIWYRLTTMLQIHSQMAGRKQEDSLLYCFLVTNCGYEHNSRGLARLDCQT